MPDQDLPKADYIAWRLLGVAILLNGCTAKCAIVAGAK